MLDAMEKYLDPTNDYAFKKMFSDEPSLKDFINRILELSGSSKIKEISQVPVEELPKETTGKRSIFDIKVKDGEGRSYIIEMQKYCDEAFLKRIEYYGSHCFVEQLARGMTHGELLPVVVIAIVGENLFPEEVPCVSFHRSRESKTNKSFLNGITYVFAELNKLEKEKGHPVEDWLHLLKYAKDEKNPIDTDNEFIKRAYTCLEKSNWTKSGLDEYIKAKLLREAEEIRIRDEKQKSEKVGIAKGEKIGMMKGEKIGMMKGEKIGMTKGEKIGIEKTAKKMFDEGIDVGVISTCTGLSVEQISELCQLLSK